MKTSLKVILTAVSIAVLASPVMAEPNSHSHAARHAADISNAHGSVSRARVRRLRPTVANDSGRIYIDDCVHVPFPQCDTTP